MSDLWKPRMRAWVQSHAGIVSVDTLTAMGCPRRDAYRLAESDEFELVMPGVLHSAYWPLGRVQWMQAACAAHPLTAVAFRTAGREWKFRGSASDDGVDVLVPHGCSPELPGVTVHRCRRIDSIDIVRRTDGIRLTSVERTLFDCADLFGGQRTASVLEQLIDEGRGTFATHASTLARLGSPRRPGTRTMRTVIGSRPAWRQAMQSELEVMVLAEIARQGLPAPEVQYRCVLPDGRRVRFDFAWPHVKLALEVDHPFWHAGAIESARDKRRDLLASTIGWQTVRLTDLDVDGGLAEAIRAVGVTLRRRSVGAG